MNNRFNIRYFNKNTKEFKYHKIGAINTKPYTDCTIYEEGQFCTGLKDKAEKLIYEGDILKINTWLDKIVPDDFDYRYENEKGFALYQIFFNQEKARFEAKCIKYTKEKPYRCFLLEYVPTNNEVIGNIYQDSHLIEN